MLSHIATDLQQVYLKEVFTPQLGKPGASTPVKPKSSSDIDGDGDVDSFEKKVRQLIYDVRHIMKEKKVPAEKAFQMRSSKTNYSAEIIKTAKEKLGIRGGSSTSVSEESTGRMVKVTINYKNGTIDRRNVPYTEVSQLRSKPTISSVEVSSNKVSYPGAGENYEKNYGGGGQNTVGDRDKDGTKEPDRHEYAGVKDTAIKKKKSKLRGYGVSEGFSNWREDLKEVAGIDDTITSRNKNQVKENPNLDNHKNKTVVINPNFAEKVEILGGTIIESVELNEEYLNEAVDIATEFFYNYGLNENGVDIVIEELGEEKFAEFVFDLSEEYFLSEARTLTGKKTSPATGKQLGISRKAAPGKRTKAAVEKHGTTRTLSSSSPSGTIKKRDIGKKIRGDEVDKAIKTAEKEQAPSSEKSRPAGQERIRKTVNDTISRVTSPEARKSVAKTAGNLARGAADTLARGALSAWQGHKKAMDTKKKGGSVAQQLGSGAGTALKSFFTKGTKQFREWVEYLISEGYDLSDWTTEELYEEYGYLCEEAESEQQQKLFGLALSVKRGETPRSEASAEVLKIVDTMSEKKIRDFAKTPHSEVPKKVTEVIANPEGVNDLKSPRSTQRQKEVVRKQTDNARMKLGIGEDADISSMSPQGLQLLKDIEAKKKRLADIRSKTVRNIPRPQEKTVTQQTQNNQLQNQSYQPEGELVDEAEQRIRQPRKSVNPRGTYDPTGIGQYPRTGKERKKMRKGEPVPKYPELKPRNNSGYNNNYDKEHPALTASQRNTRPG